MEITYRVRDYHDNLCGKELTRFDERLKQIRNQSFENLVIDFDGIENVPSLIVGSINNLATEIEKRNGKVKLVNLSEQARIIFELVELDKYITNV